jgi:hypothetical protein
MVGTPESERQPSWRGDERGSDAKPDERRVRDRDLKAMRHRRGAGDFLTVLPDGAFRLSRLQIGSGT